MSKRGLNRQVVVEAAVSCIETRGYENFSMRELADLLEVKTASLYNHIESIEALYGESARFAITKLNDAMRTATEGKERDAAVHALAAAYFHFAKEHPELYKVIMSCPKQKDASLLAASGEIINQILVVLSGYRLSEIQKMHMQRVLRSILHGFVSQRDSGYFHYFTVNALESFHIAVDCLLEGIHRMEEEESNK